MKTEIPLLKDAALDDKVFGIRLIKGRRQELIQLKANHRVDIAEWIRDLVEKELPNLKKRVGAA